MARLKFDLTPMVRKLYGHETVEEHNDEMRETFQRWKRKDEPAPCSCGFWAPSDLFCYCDSKERAATTPESVAARLEYCHRQEHQRALRQKRVFPDIKGWRGAGSCRWCLQDIRDENGQIAKRRHWHKPCLRQYNLHTRADSQLPFLLDRDGVQCAGCGAAKGSWYQGGERIPEELWENAYNADYYRRIYPAGLYEGAFCGTHWQCPYEVDHLIPLALVFEAFDDPVRRRWFFGPKNLQALCADCHKAKTAQDRAAIREAQAMGPEFARMFVLDILAARGLLKGTSPT